jgi:hypothetical protein
MTVAPTPVRGFVLRPLHVAFLAVLLLLVLALAVLLFVRVESSTKVLEGSGVSVTQVRTLPSFTAVDLAGAAHVTVRAGQEQVVEVRADDNLVERIRTEVVSGSFLIATPGTFRAVSPMTVDVAVPELEAVTLSGSGAIRIDGVDAPQFHVQLRGAGALAVAGKVERLEATLAGTGDAQLQDLVARDVVATVSGTGRLEVHATRSLDASVPGTGAIFYTGNPSDVKESVTGTGTILEP